jgi:hypothetical protein
VPQAGAGATAEVPKTQAATSEDGT